MKKFVQPPEASGYRFTAYKITGVGPFPLAEIGFIYHKMDLSDLEEPYLSAVKESLAADLTPEGAEAEYAGKQGHDVC